MSEGPINPNPDQPLWPPSSDDLWRPIEPEYRVYQEEGPQQEIKPCPFCGYKFGRVVGSFDIGRQVVCDACGACGPDQPETEDAIKEWNEAKR